MDITKLDKQQKVNLLTELIKDLQPVIHHSLSEETLQIIGVDVDENTVDIYIY